MLEVKQSHNTQLALLISIDPILQTLRISYPSKIYCFNHDLSISGVRIFARSLPWRKRKIRVHGPDGARIDPKLRLNLGGVPYFLLTVNCFLDVNPPRRQL